MCHVVSKTLAIILVTRLRFASLLALATFDLLNTTT